MDQQFNRPQNLKDLFMTFTKLALQGYGGVLAVVQRELVENKRWLNEAEFLEEWAVAQIMPGPNVVNLSLMLGAKYFGWRGALVALGGMLLAPLVVLMLLVWIHGHYAHASAWANALRGMGWVSAGLICGSAIKLLQGLRDNKLGIQACMLGVVMTFVLVALMHVPIWAVVPVLGGLGWAVAYVLLCKTKSSTT